MRIPESFYTTFAHDFDIDRYEAVACNLCGSEDYRSIVEEQGFTICECRSCGLVYVNPQPVAEALPQFYEGMYVDTSDAEMEARHLAYGPRHVGRILERRTEGLAQRRKDAKKLLEVGCGSGRLLEAIRDLPFELHAIELSARAAEHARTRVPEASIQVAGMDTAEFGEGEFDAIVSVAVLEH
ncbi:MAG: class I SAM-dependent methyltransferase, partial [Candidatus Hydrogenedentales bacterium]